MRSLGYLGAFFGGAIAGAVIGLLLAPEKGVDTRDKITKKSVTWSTTSPRQLPRWRHKQQIYPLP